MSGELHWFTFLHLFYLCFPIPKRVFLIPHALEEHRLSHRKYECDLCGKKFGKKTNLEVHKEKVHDSASTECEICNEQVDFERILKILVEMMLLKRKYISDFEQKDEVSHEKRAYGERVSPVP